MGGGRCVLCGGVFQLRGDRAAFEDAVGDACGGVAPTAGGRCDRRAAAAAAAAGGMVLVAVAVLGDSHRAGRAGRAAGRHHVGQAQEDQDGH